MTVCLSLSSSTCVIMILGQDSINRSCVKVHLEQKVENLSGLVQSKTLKTLDGVLLNNIPLVGPSGVLSRDNPWWAERFWCAFLRVLLIVLLIDSGLNEGPTFVSLNTVNVLTFTTHLEKSEIIYNEIQQSWWRYYNVLNPEWISRIDESNFIQSALEEQFRLTSFDSAGHL